MLQARWHEAAGRYGAARQDEGTVVRTAAVRPSAALSEGSARGHNRSAALLPDVLRDKAHINTEQNKLINADFEGSRSQPA